MIMDGDCYDHDDDYGIDDDIDYYKNNDDDNIDEGHCNREEAALTIC